MTTEVAVMNKSAIALAADSAVTIGPQNGKVFNSANKLFTLSKYRPIGIMLYNTMTLCGVPWETVIKHFRRNLGDRSFPTVQGYADEFFAYLNNCPVLFPNVQQEVIFHRMALRAILSVLPSLDDKKLTAKILDELINEQIAHHEGRAIHPVFEDDYARTLLSACKPSIEKAVNDAFDMKRYLPTWRAKIRTRLQKLVALMLTRNDNLDGYTGIVISGFGEEDVFPSLIEYKVDGIINGIVRAKREKVVNVNEDVPSRVMGFAQNEMIRTILEGVNPTYSFQFMLNAAKIFWSLPSEIIQGINELNDPAKQAYISDATEAAKAAFSKFMREMGQLRVSEHTGPIERAISVMPLGELATVAEIFVNATQIMQRMSLETETVGGPIDVAVISKGDGFVWIKRKHYFDRELNPHYMARYLQDC